MLVRASKNFTLAGNRHLLVQGTYFSFQANQGSFECFQGLPKPRRVGANPLPKPNSKLSLKRLL